ncbi:hypothetical protein SAMN05421595_2877 [Austwickia chelonae]|uniref:HipA-like C-terminal domain-containing protein n=1 Tax=Austwickia chelonae NBRC 105200 TaxID=1184607 RepID=K6VUN1_9MICO|nr:hypothetical protein [Austwickia chelonae]GAB79015.1 hypothetical protein AUCHE_18_00160 [Austwickia chelonae NBRC 105200]SEW41661.1 hypothetical protein SAMN05421595_2877 [Austwickia chelonae]
MAAAECPQVTAEDEVVVDVTSWAVIRDEPGGRDPNKRWLAKSPDEVRQEHWLWKSRQRTGDGSQDAITDCAEVFVSRLAIGIGLPAAECRFAVCDGKLGVISRNVTPNGYSLNTGAAYLPEVQGYERRAAEPSTGRRAGRMRRDVGYTLDAVQQVLTGVRPPPGTTDLSAFGVFAGYLVLDALTGNTDRHPGNWALLESDQDGARCLAATYDHGSALGAGLTEDKRRTLRPEAFAARGRANPFEPRKQLLVDLAHEAAARSDAGIWLSRLAALDESTVGVALQAPPGRLSEVASTFIQAVILENRRRLSDDYAA